MDAQEERNDQPIRVLRVITRLNIGGPAIQAIRLTTALRVHGFDTLLVHGRIGAKEGDMSYLLASAPANAQADTQYVDTLQRPIAPWSDIRAAHALYRLMVRFRPQILHTHMAKAGLLGRSAALVYNATHRHHIRLVHTYHGHVLEGYFSGPITKAFIQLERFLSRWTDQLIAVSDRVRTDLLVRYRIGTPATFGIVPLGFDLERFAAIDDTARRAAREALEIRPDVLVISTVGRLTAIKEHTLFLQMASLVHSRVANTTFLLVGDGELREALERETAALGLGACVRFLGWRRDLATIYAASDVFALTSRNEGTPVALIEAMASSVAAVATDVGGVRDVIDDEAKGLVVPFGNPHALADAVCTLLADSRKRARMGVAARNAVLAKFQFARLADDVAHLYRMLIPR